MRRSTYFLLRYLAQLCKLLVYFFFARSGSLLLSELLDTEFRVDVMVLSPPGFSKVGTFPSTPFVASNSWVSVHFSELSLRGGRLVCVLRPGLNTR